MLQILPNDFDVDDIYRKYKGEDSKLVGVMKEELATDLIADLQTHVNNDDYWTKPITQKEPMQQIKKGIEKILIEEK